MKRSTKVVLGTLVGLGLVTAVAARQFDGCGFAPGMSGMAQGHHTKWMAKRIGHRLDLNDAQQLQLQTLQDNMIQRFSSLQEQRLSDNDLQSLLNAEFDQLKAGQLLDQRLDTVKQNAPDVIADIASFYDQLDVNQQQQVRDMVSKRMSHRDARREHSGDTDER